MGKKAVSESTKWQIIGLFKAKKNQSEISYTLKVSRCCVQNTIATYRETNSKK